MNKFIIIPLSFLLMLVVGIRGYCLARKILRLIKNIDYEKWEFLMSSSIPLLNALIGEKSGFWVNSRRFGKFIREGNYYNMPELEKYVKKYKRHQKLTIVFIILFFVTMLALGLSR